MLHAAKAQLTTQTTQTRNLPLIQSSPVPLLRLAAPMSASLLRLLLIAAVHVPMSSQFFDQALQMATAVMPPQLRTLAGPVLNIAAARANAKKGIADPFPGGDDYPWVCPCEPFPTYPATTTQAGKCPYTSELGCAPAARLQPGR